MTTREFRRANRICGDCPAPATRTYRCDSCAQKNRDRSRAEWRLAGNARMAGKLANGICVDCMKLAVIGKRRCWDHLRRASENAARYKETVRPRKTDHSPPAQPARIDALDRKLSALGRCACGLLLPCVCLPSIYEVASNRRDAE